MKILAGVALAAAAATLWAATITLPARASEENEAAAETPTRVDMPASGADIKLVRADAHPVIEVIIHGRRLLFLVETGAWFNSISADTASELGLPIRRGEAEIDTLSVGQAQFSDMKARVVDEQPGDVDGQLGLPAFAKLLLTLDFPAHQLRLEQGELPEPNGKDVLPLQAIGPLWGVPVQVGGKAFTALLDTQSGDALAIAPPLARQVAFTGPPVATGHVHGPAIGDAPVNSARLHGDFEVGGFRFSQPIVSSFPVDLRFERLGIWLGPQLLQNFKVTLDQQHRRVRFVHAGNGSVIAPPPPLGDFGFRVSRSGDGRVRVEAVKHGSEPERIGVAEGDELVSFDRKPAAAFTETAWRELYTRPGKVRFTLRHGDEERDVEVQPTILVP